MPSEKTGSKRGRRGNGFALIELMIVVAIIGILAAIAIPTYQDFVVKAQVARAFWEASAYKIPVDERLHNGVHTFLDPQGELGYIQSPLTATANTFVFNADGSGAIVVVLDGDVHVAARNTRITVGRLTDGTWNCEVRGGNDSFKSNYLPTACTLDRSA